ncbi:uncharacterized protein BCR38DRAFT_418535, partial [Pseudomassariella vexata]
MPPPVPPESGLPWKPEKKQWMSAASIKRWVILIALCCLILFITGILLGSSFVSLKYRSISTSVPDLWNLGFGALSPFTYLVVGLPRKDPAGLISNVLLANLPQLVISILYLAYNAMLTTFLVQREFSLLHLENKRKPLRVSEPVGIQRSSYFISLPLRYGVPLYVTSGIMHWLVSQSLFLARITALTPDGVQDYDSSFSTCGYSPIAIIISTFELRVLVPAPDAYEGTIAIIVGAVLVLFIVVLGLRRYDGTMRMVSTNSRAISAACHTLCEDQKDGFQLPVQWGVVEVGEDGVGHCTFTTAPYRTMGRLVQGDLY